MKGRYNEKIKNTSIIMSKDFGPFIKLKYGAQKKKIIGNLFSHMLI